ncbi:hypothetical protein ACEZ3G_08235 [Maribacter algicola]|uniref:Uncharacterized protein n=1 Tax=Meishania litoralis TaxID=3434685 RepID=A0ACC7LPG6_9FLAO
MFKTSWFFLLFYIASGCGNFGKLDFIARLPNALKENSGIAYYPESGSLWLVEDNGNKDIIYNVDFKGNIMKELEVKNAKNHDWEDLTTDKKGNLYIGDFGNNDNDRKNLVIYKLPNPNSKSGKKIRAQQIKFNYPEQEGFPPGRHRKLFDAEAFFHHGSHLYIITKNRANPFTGEAMIYKVPDRPGDYKAKLLGRIKTCGDWDTCQVTSADISPNGKDIVLLGYGKLWSLSNFDLATDDFTKVKSREIDLDVRTQLESVCFKDNTSLFLSDEEQHKLGRNLYSYNFKR